MSTKIFYRGEQVMEFVPGKTHQDWSIKSVREIEKKERSIASKVICLCFFVTVNALLIFVPEWYWYLGFLLSLIILVYFYTYDR